MKVNQNRKALTHCLLFSLGCAVLIIALAFTVPIISDRFGPSEALAADDPTKEIMLTSIADAKELWLIDGSGSGKMADGDKIAIAIIASKLFEMRYLQTFIK